MDLKRIKDRIMELDAVEAVRDGLVVARVERDWPVSYIVTGNWFDNEEVRTSMIEVFGKCSNYARWDICEITAVVDDVKAAVMLFVLAAEAAGAKSFKIAEGKYKWWLK